MQVSSNRDHFLEQIWCDKLMHGEWYPDEQLQGIEAIWDLNDPSRLYSWYITILELEE